MHDRTERERVHSLTPPAVAQLICTQLADALDMHLPVGQTASTQPIFQIEVERLAERYQRIHPLPAHYADPWAAGRAPEAWLRAEQDTMDTLVAPGAGDVPWHNAPRTHTVLGACSATKPQEWWSPSEVNTRSAAKARSAAVGRSLAGMRSAARRKAP